MQSILLFDSDMNVATDVKFSLDLISVDVKTVGTVEEVRSELDTNPPALILTRMRVNDDPSAGARLNQMMDSLLLEKKPPIVLLGTESERARAEDEGECFWANLNLPVEFPHFTYDVQRLLAEALQEPSPENEDQIETESEEMLAEPVSAEDLGEKIAIVSELQNKAMQALSSSLDFARSGERDVPRMLTEVTRRVCEEFALSIEEDEEE